MSFRTSLIVLNAVAFVVIVGFIIWRVFSVRRNPEREDAGEPHAVPPRRGPRGAAARARARLVAHLRDGRRARPAALLPRRARRQVSANDAFLERSERAGRDALREQAEPAVRRDEVAPVRELPRRRRPGRHRAVRAPARGRHLRHRAEQGQRRRAPVPPEVGELGGARAQHRAPPLRPEAGDPDHHVRPAGHADAGRGVSRAARACSTSRASTTSSTTSQSIQISSEGRRATDSTQAVPRVRAKADDSRPVAGRRRSPTLRRKRTKDLAAGAGRPVDRRRQRWRSCQVAADERRSSSSSAAQAWRPRSTRCPTARSSSASTAPAATPRAGRTTTRRNLDLPPPPPQGSGAYGPNLRRRSLELQFPGEAGDPGAVRLGRHRRPREQPVRRPRHLVGPHAALRQAADRRTDQDDRRVRAQPLREKGPSRERVAPRRRDARTRTSGTRRSSGPRRRRRRRAVLRLDLPAPRRRTWARASASSSRSPASWASWSCSPRSGSSPRHRSTRSRAASRRGRQGGRHGPVQGEDRRGPQHREGRPQGRRRSRPPT